jgi:hypothetical protein
VANKAGMAAGVEVARISVKVSPDTKLFRTELKQQLRDIESSVKGDPIDLDLDVDTEKAEKKVDKSVQKMSGKKVKIELDTTKSKLNWYRKPSADIERMRKNIDLIDLKWDKKVAGLRMENFKPQSVIAETRAETQRIMGDFEYEWQKVRNANRELDVKFNLVDKRTLGTTLKTIFNNAQDNSSGKVKGGGGGFGGGKPPKAGKMGGDVIPSFGSGINPAGYAVILAGIAAVAAPLVGLVTTALLALPGLVGLIAAPIAAITLGLDGFKKAAETIKPQFDALKQTMSDVAQSSFTPVMQRIADEIFPKLSASLPNVTKGLSEFAQGALDAFKNDGGKFQNSITRIGDAFAQMRPGMDGFMSGIIGLIDQFTLKLPGIADWFNKSGQGFSDWVTRVSEDGTLSTAFDQLGKTIDVVLSKIADWGKASIDFMGTPGSMDGFIETLGKIGDLITDIINLSAELNKSWQIVVQGGRALGVIGNVLQGDLVGAFNNGKDLLTNKPWLENATTATAAPPINVDINSAEGKVLSLNKALENSQFKAQQAQAEVAKLVGGPAPATIQGPGFNNDYPIGGAAPATPEATARPKVPVPDATEATAAINTYKTEVTNAMNETKTAVESATAGVKAPDFSGVTNSIQEIPQAGADAMDQLVQAISQGGASAAAAATGVGTQVVAAMSGMAAQFQSVGFEMMNGVAVGIAEGKSLAIGAATAAANEALAAAKAALGIESPSKKFMEVGDYSMQGMAIGMEKGIGPVMDQARALSDKVSGVFAAGGDPTTALAGYKSKEIDAMQSVLGLQSRYINNQIRMLELQAKQAGKGPAADGFKAQAEALRSQKDSFDTQKELVDIAQEFEALKNPNKGKSSGNVFLDAINELMTLPSGFASATADQAMQDLNISGDGALQSIAGYGIDLAGKGVTNIFNTSNVDDTIALHFNQTNRQAQGVAGR